MPHTTIPTDYLSTEGLQLLVCDNMHLTDAGNGLREGFAATGAIRYH